MATPYTQVDSTYLNTITFGGYSDNIEKMYLNFLQMYPQEMDGFFISQNIGESAETVQRMDEQDMSQFSRDKAQGQDAARLTFGVGYSKEINAFRYGSQLNISYEMRVAKRFQLSQAIKRFLASVPARLELDRQHYLTFSNVTSYVNMDGRVVDTTAGDGLAYISATHPLAFVTTTWSNTVPGAPALSVTALESAQTLAITDVLDNFGLPVEMPFTHLIVNRQSPNTVRVAREILRSTSQVTQSNPNVINTFANEYELMVLTKVATDAMGRTNTAKSRWWFLAALSGLNRLQGYEFIWEAPHMNPNPAGANNGIDAYNDDYTFGARGRWGHGLVSARGLIGSLVS